MFQMLKRHSKKDVGKDVEIPLIHEKYRGFKLACYGCAELNLARRNVDRIWARRIYDAPNVAARAAVLAEERSLSSRHMNSLSSQHMKKKRSSPAAHTPSGEEAPPRAPFERANGSFESRIPCDHGVSRPQAP